MPLECQFPATQKFVYIEGSRANNGCAEEQTEGADSGYVHYRSVMVAALIWDSTLARFGGIRLLLTAWICC